MRKFFHVLCGVVAGLLAAPVSAQESNTDSGLYFSFAGAVSDGSLASSSWTDYGYDLTGRLDRTWVIDYHYGGLAAVGYQWAVENSPASFRMEAEGGYRRTYIAGILDETGTYTDLTGYLETGSVMANGYIDFQLGKVVSPYLGVGIGAARLARRDLGLVGGATFSNKFAYTTAGQFMAGVGYKLSPGTILGLEYRYMQLGEFDFPDVNFTQTIYFEEFLITFRLVG